MAEKFGERWQREQALEKDYGMCFTGIVNVLFLAFAQRTLGNDLDHLLLDFMPTDAVPLVISNALQNGCPRTLQALQSRCYKKDAAPLFNAEPVVVADPPLSSIAQRTRSKGNFY